VVNTNIFPEVFWENKTPRRAKKGGGRRNPGGGGGGGGGVDPNDNQSDPLYWMMMTWVCFNQM